MSPRMQARRLPGAVRVEVHDHHAAVCQAKAGRLVIGEILGDDTDPAADDLAVGDQVVHDPAHHVHGYGEADAFRATRFGDNGRIDAHQLTAGVDQGAPGITQIDGRIGLDEILECRKSELAATRSR